MAEVPHLCGIEQQNRMALQSGDFSSAGLCQLWGARHAVPGKHTWLLVRHSPRANGHPLWSAGACSRCLPTGLARACSSHQSGITNLPTGSFAVVGVLRSGCPLAVSEVGEGPNCLARSEPSSRSGGAVRALVEALAFTRGLHQRNRTGITPAAPARTAVRARLGGRGSNLYPAAAPSYCR